MPKYKIKVRLLPPEQRDPVEMLECVGGIMTDDGKEHAIHEVPDLLAAILDDADHIAVRRSRGIRFPTQTGTNPAWHRPSHLLGLSPGGLGWRFWYKLDRVIRVQVWRLKN